MRTPPSSQYCGLTIIIDQPSRFDATSLLSGQAGQWLDEVIPTKLSSCDVRDLTNTDPILPSTKYIALLGPRSILKFNGNPERHGYPMTAYNCLAVPGYYPQDCVDFRNYENVGVDEDEDSFSDRDTKDSYPTKRSNYRFWTTNHLRKLFTTIPSYPKPDIQPYPNLNTIISFLENLSNENLYLDIETSRLHRSITCIGLSSDSIFPKIYVVPVYRHNGSLAYGDVHRLYKALFVAFKRNTLVIHNAMFDLLILCAFYGLPFPFAVYDTMCANHRINPEAEKSLSHCISQWTWEPYHKNVDTEAFNSNQEHSLWGYNGRDVYTLKLIRDAQLKRAASDKGLQDSIAQANDSIIPYLETQMTGFRLDQLKLAQTEMSLGIAARQYKRIASMLVGFDFNPGSTKQCSEFFHKKLNYPVISRSAETHQPKLGKKQLYQLLLKHDNPLLPVILKYRAAAKDHSMLASELWSTPII